MTRFSDKIINKIKEDKVMPKPRWYFVLMHVALIMVIVLSIVFGSVAVAIVIRKMTMTDWELARLAAGGLRPVVYLLPYLWFFFVLLAIYVADKLFKQTKTGYRRKSWVIVLGSVLLSLNFGYIFYLTQFDRPFENSLRIYMPLYQTWENKRHELFAAPDRGVLAGKIIEISPNDIWVLADVKRNLWKVDVSGASFKTQFEPAVELFVGMSGEALARGEFRADVVGVWDNPPMIVLPKEGRGY